MSLIRLQVDLSEVCIGFAIQSYCFAVQSVKCNLVPGNIWVPRSWRDFAA